MTGLGAIAAWTGPALLVAVVARVTDGGVEAPLFVLAVLAAPLVGLLAASGPGTAPSGFALTIGLVTIACVLGAGFRAVGDLGHVLGFETVPVLGSAIALVLVTTVWPGAYRVAAGAVLLGAAGLAAAVAILGASVGDAPWTAWSRVAALGRFELGPRSPWITEGATFAKPLALTFTEPHRVTAVAAGVFRVHEHDRPAAVVRERRLAAGESLTLRPGDTLAIPAGARLRFERGKRAPGTPESGVAWADRLGTPRARLLAWWLGLTVTLAGGAVVVVHPAAPPSRMGGILAPAVVLSVVLGAACWGVYMVAAAPELVVGARPVDALVRLVVVVADEPWRGHLLSALVLALLALLLASAAALRQRLADFGAADGGWVGRALRRRFAGAAIWSGLVVAAAAGGALGAGSWPLLFLGVGLASATRVGPLLATGDGPGLERARARGALAGGALFVAVAAAGHRLAPLPGALEMVAQFPALVAVPAAWLVASLSRAAAPVPAEMVAAARRR